MGDGPLSFSVPPGSLCPQMGLVEGWLGELEPGEGRPGFPGLLEASFVLLGPEVLCVGLLREAEKARPSPILSLILPLTSLRRGPVEAGGPGLK